MAILVYLLCAGAGYLAEEYLPYTDASPYIALFVSYHLFLTYFVVRAVMKSEQKIGLSMPIPVAAITHLAFVGAMIGIVMGREYVPLFALLKFVVPSLAPFEVKWVFEGNKHSAAKPEPARMPSGTHEEYTEFLGYLKQSNRRFQLAGRTVQEEFGFWLKDRNRGRSETAKPAITRQG
jgi:hypothetical protein